MKLIKFFFLSAILAANHVSQWQPDFRLTNNSGNSYTSPNNSWCVASAGDTLHVVWEDNRDGNYEIYYKRSTDAGLSWNIDTRLTDNSGNSYSSCIVLTGQLVHVVWQEFSDGNPEIYYKRSTNGGSVWEPDTRLTDNSGISGYACITASGLAVNVVWEDDRDGNFEIYFKRSTDGGSSWNEDIRLTNNNSGSRAPSVSFESSALHVVFSDNRVGNYEIYYKRSDDGGLIWSTDTQLTNNPAISSSPCISASGSGVNIVWCDLRIFPPEIYYKRSDNGGFSWGEDIRLTNNSAISNYPNIKASGLNIHLVWNDNRDGNYEIYYKHSGNEGLSWGIDTRLTNNTFDSYFPSVTASGKAVNVVWYDNRDGNNEIYFKHNPSGNSIGITKVGNIVPNGFSLSQNNPNPFNLVTRIRFSIPVLQGSSIPVSLNIYDIIGRNIQIITDKNLLPGEYESEFNGAEFSSGIYFYRLTSGNFTSAKKMILLK